MLDDKTYWKMLSAWKTAHIQQITPKFKQEMNRLARVYTDDCILIAQREFKELLLNRDVHIDVRTDWSTRRTRSNGGCTRDGKASISIAMIRATVPFDVIEYSRFNHDDTIGYFETDCSKEHLKVTVAHEVAHAIQYTIKNRQLKRGNDTWKNIKPHGYEFKMIYHVLREQYCNPVLRGYAVNA